MSAPAIEYNRAKVWQIGFFAGNNLATNSYAAIMMYIAYYVNGVAGIAIAVVSVLLTVMRIFDGITDPFIGALIDKTQTRFGKFRPFMVAGNIVMALSIATLFLTLHNLENEIVKIIVFALLYVVYILGYTMQTAVTKAGQTALTNDPKQRPLFSLFDSIMIMTIFGTIPLYVSIVLAKKHGGLGNIGVFQDLVPLLMTVSAICTVFAVIGIWNKDNLTNYGTGKTVKIKFADYVDVMKNNRALQMIIVAAASDKLAIGVSANATVAVIVYGIFFGNFEMSGLMSIAGMLGGTVITIIGVSRARKKGLRNTQILFTKFALASYTIIAIVMFLAPQGGISLKNFGWMTVVFVVCYVFGYGSFMVAGNVSIPMIADCADYETYRTGKYIPGMMGTLFSFVDKVISSFSTTIVGFAVLIIGYSERFPDLGTPYAPALKYLGIVLFCGLPMLGWILSLIAMRYYPLTKEKMEEVQAAILEMKHRED